jgi:hypothetical protein
VQSAALSVLLSMNARRTSVLLMSESQPVRFWAGVRCVESGREDDGSEHRGWKAFLGDADGGDEALVFCPHCSEREFGGE